MRLIIKPTYYCFSEIFSIPNHFNIGKMSAMLVNVVPTVANIETMLGRFGMLSRFMRRINAWKISWFIANYNETKTHLAHLAM